MLSWRSNKDDGAQITTPKPARAKIISINLPSGVKQISNLYVIDINFNNIIIII